MSDETPPPDSGNISTSTVGQGAEGVRSWERAWSLDEMRKGAGNWSLAGDAGLLQYLQEFSQKMISRTHEIEKEVDSLVQDAKSTGVRVNNVFNDFIMLANTQFVENRVYDEDVSQEETTQEEKNPDDQEKTREERESELIPKVTEAISLGVNVIEDAFEKLDTNIDNSDSEDEDASYRVDPILEAKDPYVLRALPFLIGSANFMEDDNVGIEDVSDEESDHGSLSESESEEDKENNKDEDEYSSSESESELETERPKDKRIIGNISESEDSGSEGSLFGSSNQQQQQQPTGSDGETEEDSDRSEEEQKQQKPSGPVDFASELAKKIGGAPVIKPPSPVAADDSETETTERKAPQSSEKKHKKKDRDKKGGKNRTKSKEDRHRDEDDDLFGPPPVEDEDDDIFGSKGRFGKGKGLFDDDDDDEGGIFDEIERKPSKKSFTDEEEAPKHKKERRRTSSGKKVRVGVEGTASPKAAGGLFDDDEDDLFSTVKAERKTEPKNESAKAAQGGMFDDDEDDMFGETTQKPVHQSVEKTEDKHKHKLPAGAVSMFGKGPNPLMAALKKKQQDSEEEEDNDWSEGDKSRSGSLKSDQSGGSKSSAAKMSSGQSKDSLFTEEPDDALFSSMSKPKAHSITKAGEKTGGSSLFGGDEEEDDLFGRKPSPPKAAQNKVRSKPKLVTAELFGEDEEDDLFGVPKPKSPERKKPVGGVSLFPEDPFNKKIDTEPKKEESGKTVTTRPKTKSISLFGGDDDDEEGDLFGAGPPKPTQQNQQLPATTKKTASLFDDEGLFAEEENPNVDIFNKPPSPTPTKAVPPQEPQKAPNITTVTKPIPSKHIPALHKSLPSKAKPSASLFGDDSSDDDLFGAGTKKVSKITSKVEVQGATTTESTDTQDEKQQDEPARKKPVGGVSMFGGVNPFADRLKKSDIEKNKTEPKPSGSKKTLKSADPLFGGGDDDDDDLFVGGATKKPAAKPAAEPVPIKSESNKALSSNLFGSPSPEKDLFTSSANTPKANIPKVQKDDKPKVEPVAINTEPVSSKSDNLFGSPSPDKGLFGSPAEAKKTDIPKSKSDPVQIKPENKPKPDNLFGSISAEEDLFSASVKSKKPENKEPEQTGSRNIPDSDGDLFGPPDITENSDNQKRMKDPFMDDDENDDLFSAAETKKRQESLLETDHEISNEPESPVQVKPKKPAGAVSMFGGMDPSALGEKKTSLTLDTDSNLHHTKPKPPTPQEVVPDNKLATKSPAAGKIGRLQASLNFNPAAMLPGSAPPVKEPEPVEIGFDVPAEAKTLTSANKDRAKIQSRRRPPSRAARKTAAAHSSGGLSDDFFGPQSPISQLTGSSAHIPPIVTSSVSPPRVLSPADVADTSKSRSAVDMFGNEDIFSNNLPKSSAKSVITSRDTDTNKSSSGDIFSDEFFSAKTTKKTAKADDFDDLFAGPANVAKPKADSIINDDSDIFNSVPKNKNTKTKQQHLSAVKTDDNISIEKTKPKSKPIAVVDDNNLFSSPMLSNKTKEKTPKSVSSDDKSKDNKIQEDGLQPVDNSGKQAKGADSEDDVFPASSLSKKTEVKREVVDDDIFADSSLKPKDNKNQPEDTSASPTPTKTNRKKKKAMTKDEDLFVDDTDIFADIPKPKEKEPKKKKKTMAAPKKTLFKDDIDDIFADTAPTKPKDKKEKKKITASSVSKDKGKSLDDIFDDPLGS